MVRLAPQPARRGSQITGGELGEEGCLQDPTEKKRKKKSWFTDDAQFTTFLFFLCLSSGRSETSELLLRLNAIATVVPGSLFIVRIVFVVFVVVRPVQVANSEEEEVHKAVIGSENEFLSASKPVPSESCSQAFEYLIFQH